MEKVRPLFLTTIAQLGYGAILLQAFVIPPPLTSFRPCGCTVIMPDLDQRLILLNQISTSSKRNSAESVSEAGAGKKFCPKSNQLAKPPVLKDLRLDNSLQQLLSRNSAQITFCVTLNSQGGVATVTSYSGALSEKDQSLIKQYVIKNWEFEPRSNIAFGRDDGPYRMTLAVSHQAVW